MSALIDALMSTQGRVAGLLFVALALVDLLQLRAFLWYVRRRESDVDDRLARLEQQFIRADGDRGGER